MKLPCYRDSTCWPCADIRGTYRRCDQLTLSGQAYGEAIKEGRRPLQSKSKIMNRRLTHRFERTAKIRLL